MTIDDWICCLNERERWVLRDTALLLAAELFIGVPVLVWDAYWATFPSSGVRVREAFREIYRLEIATIPINDEDTAVVRPAAGYLPLWVDWSLYMVTFDPTCASGCGQSELPA